MTDAEILKTLGGPSRVAHAIGAQKKAAHNWPTRGIPWKWRPHIAELAERAGVSLPADFSKAKGV